MTIPSRPADQNGSVTWNTGATFHAAEKRGLALLNRDGESSTTLVKLRTSVETSRVLQTEASLPSALCLLADASLFAVCLKEVQLDEAAVFAL